MYPEESGWKTSNIDGRLFKIANETNVEITNVQKFKKLLLKIFGIVFKFYY